MRVGRGLLRPPSVLVAAGTGLPISACCSVASQELKYSAADVLAVKRLLSALAGREPHPLPRDADSALVAQEAEGLRASALPPAAHVGGATTFAALGGKLLEARYDVGSLSAYDLLRLDYKQVGSGPYLRSWAGRNGGVGGRARITAATPPQRGGRQ